MKVNDHKTYIYHNGLRFFLSFCIFVLHSSQFVYLFKHSFIKTCDVNYPDYQMMNKLIYTWKLSKVGSSVFSTLALEP